MAEEKDKPGYQGTERKDQGQNTDVGGYGQRQQGGQGRRQPGETGQGQGTRPGDQSKEKGQQREQGQDQGNQDKRGFEKIKQQP